MRLRSCSLRLPSRAYTRTPWHSRKQLGESLIPLMNLDPRACEGQNLRFVLDQALGAVHAKALRLWEEFQRDPQAQWEPEGQAAFGRLGSFVVAAFLGTAGLGLKLDLKSGVTFFS